MKLGAPGRYRPRVGKPPGVENSEVLSQTRLMDLLLGQEHVGHKGDTAVETQGASCICNATANTRCLILSSSPGALNAPIDLSLIYVVVLVHDPRHGVPTDGF